jgi:aryl-alcohol dehydrogenase-like predicted oxidoreductase
LEASAESFRRAHAVHPVTALQSEWSLFTRRIEDEILSTCRELGVGVVPFSPLGRGFLTGGVRSMKDLPEDDMRRGMPRFAEGNFEKNLKIVDRPEVKGTVSTSPGCRWRAPGGWGWRVGDSRW